MKKPTEAGEPVGHSLEIHKMHNATLNVTEQNSKPTMSSLELLDVINVSRDEHGQSAIRRNDFHARVADELEGEFYETFVIPAGPSGGRPSQGFLLNHDQCLLVSMRESKAVRRSVLAKLKQKEQPFQLPKSMAEALRLAADQAEQIEEQQRQIEQARPSVEFVERYVSADSGNKGFRQVAKLLKANERDLRAFLADHKIMYRLGGEWMPYQNHIDAGRFVVKAGVAENEHAFNTAKFTPKGINWLASLWETSSMEGVA